jgi:hypothetical protein
MSVVRALTSPSGAGLSGASLAGRTGDGDDWSLRFRWGRRLGLFVRLAGLPLRRVTEGRHRFAQSPRLRSAEGRCCRTYVGSRCEVEVGPGACLHSVRQTWDRRLRVRRLAPSYWLVRSEGRRGTAGETSCPLALGRSLLRSVVRVAASWRQELGVTTSRSGRRWASAVAVGRRPSQVTLTSADGLRCCVWARRARGEERPAVAGCWCVRSAVAVSRREQRRSISSDARPGG